MKSENLINKICMFVFNQNSTLGTRPPKNWDEFEYEKYILQRKHKTTRDTKKFPTTKKKIHPTNFRSVFGR